MQPEIFTAHKTGELVPVFGISGLTHAFVPDSLPPRWAWPTELWPLLQEARIALASLDGTGKHLPNPELVLRPIQAREAQLSSRLEGTITDPQQQALFKIDPKFPQSDSDPANSLREIFNYGTALRLCLSATRELPLSLRLIRDLHAVLMEGVRGSDQSPGAFRRTQNQIGRPARYVPPPMTHLAQSLDAFEKYLHEPKALDPLVEAFIVHYQFEAIHPFGDGNGRVGRLLLAVTIAEWCGLSNQWLYMSAHFERNKDRYLDLLRRVSTHGDWEGWVRFCLEGVVSEARDTQRRLERLLTLNRDFHERVKTGSVRLRTIVDDLFDTPVVTVTQIRQKHGVTYPTAKADLQRLVRCGIVEPLRGAKQNSYFCPHIFAITYDE